MSIRKSLIFSLLILFLYGSNLNVIGTGNKVNADLIIYPDQDTFTSGLEINGLREYIVIRLGVRAFLRFPVEQIISADLVYLEMNNYVDEITTIGVYGVDNDAWDELTLFNAEDLPADTELLDEVQILGDSWYKWDITDFVNSQTDGWVTLRVENIEGVGKFQGHSKDAGSDIEWPFLSVNGAIHTQDIPEYEIYSTSTKTETVYTDTLLTTTIVSEVALSKNVILISTFFIALINRKRRR